MSKKRKNAEQITALRRVISGETRHPDWPADLSWAWGELHGEADRPPSTIDPEVGAALIEELLHRQDAEVLNGLARADHKRLAKAARTALHRLRTRKVSAPSPRPGGGRPRGTGNASLGGGELDSLVSAYDQMWERDLLVVDTLPAGASSVVWARVSADHGLFEINMIEEISRRQYRELRRRMEQAVPLCAAPFAEARWLLEDAIARRRQAGRGLPEGLAQACMLIGPPPGGDHPVGVTASEAGNEQMTALFALPELERWTPDSQTLQQLGMRLEEVATSRLMVDENQRVNQMTATVDRFLEDYFDDGRCRAAQRLLLDTAHMLRLRGADEAGVALAAAGVFDGPRARTLVHPFVRAFVERLVRYPTARDGGAVESKPNEPEPDEKTSEGGLIITGR